MTKQIIETEAHNLFELLKNIVVEQQSREKIITQNTLRVNRSYRISLVGTFVCLLLFLFYLKLLSDNKDSFSESIEGVLIVLFMFFLLGAFGLFILIPVIVGIDVLYKDSKESTQNLLNRIERDNLFIQGSAKKISKFIGLNLSTLEFVKTDLKLEIDIIQSKEKILDSLVPLLAVVVVVVIVFILGINTQDVKSPVTSVGIAAGTPPLIFQFFYKRRLQNEIINLKMCITILEQAQALANNTESK